MTDYTHTVEAPQGGLKRSFARAAFRFIDAAIYAPARALDFLTFGLFDRAGEAVETALERRAPPRFSSFADHQLRDPPADTTAAPLVATPKESEADGKQRELTGWLDQFYATLGTDYANDPFKLAVVHLGDKPYARLRPESETVPWPEYMAALRSELATQTANKAAGSPPDEDFRRALDYAHKRIDLCKKMDEAPPGKEKADYGRALRALAREDHAQWQARHSSPALLEHTPA
jgi:hypothetical protein